MSLDLDPPPSLVELVTDTFDGKNNINKSLPDSIWKKWFNNFYEWALENMNKDFLLEVKKGNIDGHRIVDKFGSSLNVTNTGFTVISHGDVYQVPTTAQSLEFISDNAGDALNGAGMHELTIEGLDANWDLQTVSVAAHATDGTIAVAITGTWLRVFRAYVTKSGSYATLAVPSHLGNIDIQNSGAGVLWASIINTDIPHGQTQIAAYTVPAGEVAYLGETNISTEVLKAVNVFGFRRPNSNDITTPFDGAMRSFTEVIGVEGGQSYASKTWKGPFDQYTDLGYLGKSTGAGTNSASIDFEILLIDRDLVSADSLT
jgi:hypothetical protein